MGARQYRASPSAALLKMAANVSLGSTRALRPSKAPAASSLKEPRSPCIATKVCIIVGIASLDLCYGSCNAGLDLRAKQPAKKEFRICLCKVAFRDGSFDPVPLIQPVDHAQQGECRQCRRNRGCAFPFMLHLGDEVFEKMRVLPLASVNFIPQRAAQ